MKRFLPLLLLFFFFLFVGGAAYFSSQVPKWKKIVNDLVIQSETAQLDPEKWETIRTEAKTLPSFFPISCAKNVFIEAAEIVSHIEKLKSNFKTFFSGHLQTQDLDQSLDSITSMRSHLDNIEKNLESFPHFLLTSEQRAKQQNVLKKIATAKQIFDNADLVGRIVRKFADNKERVLILFQNQNEPRSTGGFVGSFVILDFGKENVSWQFSDIYAFDRLVKPEDHLPAPDFFHPLSQTISLRDANFFPNFPTTADTYRKFFKNIGEKEPNTVIAINLNFVGEILKLTGPLSLSKWNMEVDSYNFDMVLQFLIESKIEGRFGVKNPLLYFSEQLFQMKNFEKITAEKLADLNLSDFFSAKNVLANSQNSSLQKFFNAWKIDGILKKNTDADNFLYFDFVSVGANKSEKFIWTKIWHDSKISKLGRVHNTLEVTRTNALTSNEISDLLGTNSWSPNVRDLLTKDVLWTLGQGQNRTVLRVWVPSEAKPFHQIDPSGTITESFSPDKKFKIFDVPLFINPGEKIKAHLEYDTFDDRGNTESRPYFLQIVGTPGRSKTTFLGTISTEDKGTFRIGTQNIGEPLPLFDQYLRTVIDFPE